MVSVIIPFYNAEHFLDETIKSVLIQTWKDIELILIDDGSDDESYSIAKSYESEKVKVYSYDNHGACYARNRGFEKSSGDLIQFLDADDLLSPTKIESQVRLLESMEDGFIASAMWGKFGNSIDSTVWSEGVLNNNFVPSYKWLLESWKGRGMGQTAIWLSPKELIKKAGPWNESLQINQDGEFFSRVLMHSKGVCFCEDAKVYYRSGNVNSVSQSQKFSREKAKSLLYSYQLYKNNAKHLGVVNQLKEGIGHNFLTFIYQYSGKYQDLVEIATAEFYDLGYDRMWSVGGKNFKKLSSIIGFRAALIFKKYLTK